MKTTNNIKHKMKKLAYISRHKITPAQRNLALQMGYTLHDVGDRDAFTVDVDEFLTYDGVVVVNPAMALRLLMPALSRPWVVGVYENGMRGDEGAPAQFHARRFHTYSLVTNDDQTHITSSAAEMPRIANLLPIDDGTRQCQECGGTLNHIHQIWCCNNPSY